MRKLIVFNMLSLDGFFVDERGQMDWAHNSRPDADWDDFVATNARGGGLLVFGRLTYELMASYWPTPAAIKGNPVVARRMNELPKLAVSRTMKSAAWNNTRLVRDGVPELRMLKAESGPDMVIMGSGSLVSQLAQERLIDEYQIVVIPVILGKGRTMFEGVKGNLVLSLTRTRSFENGNVLLCYENEP